MFSSLLASAAAIILLASHVVSDCVDVETPVLTCYTEPDGVPQDVSVADITYVAAYLRAYGAQTKAGRQFTQTVDNAPDCAEWTLYQHGTVLALGKHIDSAVNSSVLFADIANTIDGGANATPEQQLEAIIGCATNGGSFGVVYNATNPQYNTAAYLANNYTPEGIVIKIVTAPV
ncbi:hypothetical protein V492_01415 [Pseudogymnoascus sp. VKM F-4246]|nr:hypothetical protein V492_01415 [Pseudogymnoascus sp. VKM F-4246]